MRKMMSFLSLTLLTLALLATGSVAAQGPEEGASAQMDGGTAVPLDVLFNAPQSSLSDPIPPSICGYQYDTQTGCGCQASNGRIYWGSAQVKRFCCHGECGPWEATSVSCTSTECMQA